MKLIIGLGNKGEEYNNTRHNFGFMFIDYLEKKHNFKCNKKNKNSLVGEIKLNNEKIVFVKPQTYMNLSSQSVIEILKWYKESVNNIIVIYDDIDIPFGTIRYKENGSGGSHNGMKDIINNLKTNDIFRIRLGIGDLKKEKEDISNFVLSKFSKDELLKVENIFIQAEEKLLEFLDK